MIDQKQPDSRYTMSRSPARRRARVTSALTLATLVILAAAIVACGDNGGSSPSSSTSATVTETPTAGTSPSPSPSPSPSATTTGTTRLSVYFLRGEYLGVAERSVPRTKAVAAAALRELCAGPSTFEQEAGLSSAVPEGTELRSVEIHDRVAAVDLSAEYATGGGSLSVMERIAQVVYTVTQFPTVDAVTFSINGEPVTSLGGEGVVVSSPQSRADWVDLEPAIFVESPGVGAVLSSPFVLRGSASVFEANFIADLLDAKGKRVVRSIMQASVGAPERGTFRKSIEFSTTAEGGELAVYEVSMEDGSHLNEVRIPVIFAP